MWFTSSKMKICVSCLFGSAKKFFESTLETRRYEACQWAVFFSYCPSALIFLWILAAGKLKCVIETVNNESIGFFSKAFKNILMDFTTVKSDNFTFFSVISYRLISDWIFINLNACLFSTSLRKCLNHLNRAVIIQKICQCLQTMDSIDISSLLLDLWESFY